MRPDGTPDDYVPSTYYKRKTRHADEMTGWIVGAWVVAFVVIGIALIVSLFRSAEAQEIPVPLSTPCSSGECTVYNQAFVFALTGQERTIGWSLDPNDVANMTLFTEITVFEFPPKAAAFPVMKAELPEVDRSIGWTPNRAGTYFVNARACRTDGDLASEPEAEQHPSRGVILCSIIAASTDPAHVDAGVYPRGFVMLIKLAPATGGGIE